MVIHPLSAAILKLIHQHLGLVLDAAKVGLPTPHQYEALRKFTLDEFGDQVVLPELDHLMQEYGMAGNGRAKTAGKEVPR